MKSLTFTQVVLFLIATRRRAAVTTVVLSAISGLGVGFGISGIVLSINDVLGPPSSFLATLAVALLVKVLYKWWLVLFLEPRAQKAREVRLDKLGYTGLQQELLAPIELSPNFTLTTVAAAMAVAYYLLTTGENNETIRLLTAAVGVVVAVGEHVSSRSYIRLIYRTNSTTSLK